MLAAYSAIIKGANKVMVVDRHPDRLRLAEQIGAIPIDDSKVSPVDQILEQTGGMGADRGCEAVGHQAHDPSGQEKSALTLNNLVHSVRFGGTIGVVGVFFPKDPGSPDPLQKQGKAPFDYGMFWFKGQSMGHRSVQREELQPAAGEPHREPQGRALFPGVARAEAGPGTGGVSELRCPR